MEACHRLALREGQKENKKEVIQVTEKKLTVGTAIKIVVFTVLALIGFFALWGITFLLSLAFTLNIVLSLLLSLLISAVTIFALITVLVPPRKRIRVVLSKRQKVGAYVAYAIIFALSLPLIKINLLAFLCILPTLLFVLCVVVYDILRKGKMV